MTNLKNVLSVGLAVATLAAVFPFFAGGGKVLYTSEARPLGYFDESMYGS
jgi:hypothetical protein